eukprot:4337245-Lingulodinium_polyedra.AAC.1
MSVSEYQELCPFAKDLEAERELVLEAGRQDGTALGYAAKPLWAERGSCWKPCGRTAAPSPTPPSP